MEKKKLDIIKKYAFENFSIENENEQFTMEFDDMAVSCPWMDLSGRFELNDEEAVKTYGLTFIMDFCEKIKETKDFKEFYAVQMQAEGYTDPEMYIKDMETGRVRPYGSDPHDSLVISEDGTHLYYHNLHNGDSSRAGYRFVVDETGKIPSEDEVLTRHGADAYFNIGGFKEAEG